jgi:polysaccharide biosynthesis/export protein
MKLLTSCCLASLLAGVGIADSSAREESLRYVLGPDDVINVRVTDLEEFDSSRLGAIRIDQSGTVRVPIVGRIQAAGLTVEQLEAELTHRLSNIMHEPEVIVDVAEFRSHRVSVLGAVKNPGVYQLTGSKPLFEILSLAGGLNPDAGNVIKVTRPVASGSLPLPGAELDLSGEFFVGQIDIRGVMQATSPGENIPILAEDVITVPKADLVYVVGAVRRSGGFVLNEKEQITVLQALSLSEGLDRTAGPKNARILRQTSADSQRSEIPVNVQRILEGRDEDVALLANDILFIPTSKSKAAGIRALEAVVQMGTGVVIWRR